MDNHCSMGKVWEFIRQFFFHGNDIVGTQIGVEGPYAAGDIKSDAAGRNHAALFGIEGGHSAYRKPIPPMGIGHGKRGLDNSRERGYIHDLFIDLEIHVANECLIRVNNSDYFLESISQTFHGRDMIAPAGAYITKGVKLNQFGPEIDKMDVVRLADMGCRISDTDELIGKIVSIDHFGNLITNISSKDLVDYCKKHRDGKPRIWIGKRSITGLVKAYESAKSQAALALIGSRGYLEIAVNGGSAKQYFDAKKGDALRVVI